MGSGAIGVGDSNLQDEARTPAPTLSPSPSSSSPSPSPSVQVGTTGDSVMGQRLSTATSDRLFTLQGQLAALSLVREHDDDATQDGSVSGNGMDELTHQRGSMSTGGRLAVERRRMSLDGTPSEMRWTELDGAKAATMRRPQSMFLAQSLALLPQDHADLIFPSHPKTTARLPLAPTSSINLNLPRSASSRTLPAYSAQAPTSKECNNSEGPISSFLQPLDSPSALQLDLRSLPQRGPFPTRRPGSSLPLRLPTIPSSPNPPLTPRRLPSDTLAPVLPPLVPTPPLLTPEFWLVPPSATLAPRTSSSWPVNSSLALYTHPKGTHSTPDLSFPLHLASSSSSSAGNDPLDTSTFSPPEPALPARSFTNQGLQTGPFSRADNLAGAEEIGQGSLGKSYHALLELVTTEKAYLDSLRILVKIYFRTLPFLAILSTAEIAAVVRNADSLLELHERLVTRISQVGEQVKWELIVEGSAALSIEKEERVREAAWRIAQVFSDELPNFALYENFCARHRESVDIVRAVESRLEWEAFERNCAAAASASRAESLPSSSSTFSDQETTILPSSPAPILSPPHTTVVTPFTSALPVSQSSKLRFHDYAIQPIQRICRYPMIFAQIMKHLPADGDEAIEIFRAGEGLRNAAVQVDVAKSVREGELRTQVIAQRMEFPTPVHLAFCDILGPSRLIGSLYVVHRSPGAEIGRSKYYGCFLYRSHLVMAKIKKRDSYEPREWLPLRQFELTDVTDGEGLMPHSIRLSHKDHHFELGATCHEEKVIWLATLRATHAEATKTWADQPLDEFQQPTLFDDTLVSSVYPKPYHGPSNSSSPPPSKWPHRRADSASSLPAVLDHILRPGEVDRGSSSPLVRRGSSIASASSQPGQNLSRTTPATLFARIPSPQRATIDLRLSDIVSGELLAARMLQLTRETLARPSRMRTISGSSAVKRGPQSFGRLTLKERRRMSLIEPGQTERDPNFRGPVGFDAGGISVYRDEIIERKWSSALKKSKSTAGEPRARPSLPMIDTSLAQSSSDRQDSSWKSRTMALRRAASQSSLDRPRPSTTSDATDIERNNSVSSSASSSCIGSRSTSSQHTQDIETPGSSLPPSPNLRCHELRPATSGHSLDGSSKALQSNRRCSQLLLAKEERIPATVIDEVPVDGLSRRGSFFGDYIQRRVASSPTLSTLFSNASSHSMSRYQSDSLQPTPSLRSTSSPHLPLEVDSPISTTPSTPGTSPDMHSSLTLKADTELASERGATKRARSLRFAFARQFKLSPISPVDGPQHVVP